MQTETILEQPNANHDVERRPYAPPRLTVHGDAARLTATITPPTGADITGGSLVDL